MEKTKIKRRIKEAEAIFHRHWSYWVSIPFPLSSAPNKEALPLLINECGWDGEAAFRELCAVPKLPREKPVSIPVAGSRRALPTSPSTRQAGTSCYRMAKGNGRTLSTVWGGEEQGAAVMEDLRLGIRQWQTL